MKNVKSHLIIGVDEVGYGALAGPLVAVAVAFDSTTPRPMITLRGKKKIFVSDSKRVNQKLLHPLADLVKETCIAYETQTVAAHTIDVMRSHRAKRFALRVTAYRLLERLALEHPTRYKKYRVIVDGDTDLGACYFEYEAFAHADELCWQCGAASLIAKEIQITQMIALHENDNRYHWHRNKGYATKQHLDALQEFGVSEHHRKSYRPVREILNNQGD